MHFENGFFGYNIWIYNSLKDRSLSKANIYMAIRQKLKLGDVLVQAGAITEEQLIQSLNEQKQNNVPLGKALVQMGFCLERRNRPNRWSRH